MFKFTFTSFPPTKNDMNNAILTAPNAMPFKDANSSGDSNFSSGRRVFNKSLDLSIYNAPTGSTKQKTIWKQQKFYGSTNHDASARIERRRDHTIGLATTNPKGLKISFS